MSRLSLWWFLRPMAALLAASIVLAACATNINITAVETTEDGTDAAGDDGRVNSTGTGTDDGTSESPTDVPEPVEPTPTTIPARDFTLDEAIEVYFASVEEYWRIQSPAVFDQDFEPVTAKIPYRPRDFETVPACGGEFGPEEIYFGNAFYCPADDFIAWDNAQLFPDLYQDFGDFTVGLVIAHEYGHAMQARTQDRARTIVLELQADCYAGAWAGDINASAFPLSGSDLNGALNGFLLFRDPLGTDASDPNAHGSAFDRVTAFTEGFRSGAAPCAGYIENPPEVANILLDTFDENEGNLPLDQLIPLLVGDLEVYLQTLGDEIANPGFNAPDAAVPFGGSLGDPEGCGGIDLAADDVRGVAFLCTTNGDIYYDRSEMDELFDINGAGDFAPAYSLAHAYAQSVVVGTGVTDPLELVLAGDCVVGLWARDIFDEQDLPRDQRTHELSLSAGDLDEGVFGLIAVPATVPQLTTTVEMRAFDRVAAFGDGFFDGQQACGL